MRRRTAAAEVDSAGARDRPVLIEQQIDAAPGFPVETWTTLVDGVWMSRRDTSGVEAQRAGMTSGSFSTVWQMPYREDMDPELVDVAKSRRLVANGRSYDIQFGSVIGRGDAIELVTMASTEVRE